jgi:putative tryptophan/tyrosine transport system substrate-binding protein
MRRREFIAGLGSAAIWPMAARAQQPVVPVIGWLTPTVAGLDSSGVNAAFRRGLSEFGFVEGRNVTIETTAQSFTWTDCRPWPRMRFAAG